MNLITLDFETFYSSTYSLSKMTTEEYIRGPEFEVIGVSVKVNDAQPMWFSGSMDETKTFLESFDWDDSMLIAHNTMFDGAILSWCFGIKPKALADTLSMARALHGTEVGGSLKALAEHYELGQKGTEVLVAIGKRREDFDADSLARYGDYCINDTELTYKLFHCMVVGFPAKEMKLIDLTLRMYTEPKLVLDNLQLVDHLHGVQTTKELLLENLAIGKAGLMSSGQFANALTRFGVSPPTKISPTTGKQTWAFSKSDEEFMELLEHPDVKVQALVAARLGVKSTLEETRTQRFIEIAARGLMPVPLRYYAAHTGRWGGDDKVNLQNVTRGSPIKKAILAPPGYVIIDSDSSQIEARTLAWFAGQDDLVEAFRQGEDVYSMTACIIYGQGLPVNAEKRFIGKTTVLGCGYGMGAIKFQAQLKKFGVNLPLYECENIVKAYREQYFKIPELWRQAQTAIEAMANNQTVPLGLDGVVHVEGKKGIRLPNGLYLKYPNLRRVTNEEGKTEYVYDVKKGKTVIPNKIYGGKMIENICQALARIIIGDQLLAIAKRCPVVLTVHDAIACLVPDNAESHFEGVNFVVKEMRKSPAWAAGLPLNCEAGMGRSYGEC